jgi:hypothetical protein
MARPKNNTADPETPSAYFRRVFREDRSLLKSDTNQPILDRWLKDHPDHKEVPNNIKGILHTLKSRLRQKRRRQQRAQRAEAAPASTTVASSRRTDKSLAQLEERIDACLAVARAMDAEGLAEVIERLRAARNAVVRMAGG